QRVLEVALSDVPPAKRRGEKPEVARHGADADLRVGDRDLGGIGGELVEKDLCARPIAARMRHVGEEPHAYEPLFVERDLDEVALCETREDPRRVVLTAELVVEPCKRTIDDRIGPERGGLERGLLCVCKLVETPLTASKEVKLEASRHLGVPAWRCVSELLALGEQALCVAEAALEQREQRLVHGDEPKLRRLPKLLRNPPHLRQARPGAVAVAEPEKLQEELASTARSLSPASSAAASHSSEGGIR